jgi:hypothetical protein
MSGPNWAKLVSEGRAQGIGIPLSEEQIHARSLGIPKEFYLHGIVTLEQYEAARKKGVTFETQADVEAEAKDAGIAFVPGAPVDSLKGVIERTKKGGKKK